MISRSRSGPTVAAMSIDCTTSPNSTVTCLYSADRLTCVTGAPHSLQNLEFGGSSVPHNPHGSPAAVSAPLLLSSPSLSFHRCSTMSVISPCDLRHQVLRPSYVVYSGVQLCSGLVDLVVCIGHHLGGSHRFTSDKGHPCDLAPRLDADWPTVDKHPRAPDHWSSCKACTVHMPAADRRPAVSC